MFLNVGLRVAVPGEAEAITAVREALVRFRAPLARCDTCCGGFHCPFWVHAHAHATTGARGPARNADGAALECPAYRSHDAREEVTFAMFTYLYSAVRDPILHALFTGNMYRHVDTQQALFTSPRTGLPTTESEVDVAAAELAAAPCAPWLV